MELLMYWRIFQRHAHVFFLTVLLFVIIGFFWQISQRDFVISHVTFNITRTSSEKTSDYQYHNFYRLQADERFADTVVRWMQTPRVMYDTYNQAHISPVDTHSWPIQHKLTAERLSSQMIDVSYAARNDAEAKVIAQSLADRVNALTASLNNDQQESAWFMVIHDEPISQSGTYSLVLVLSVMGALGVFMGCWVVLGAHYVSQMTRK